MTDVPRKRRRGRRARRNRLLVELYKRDGSSCFYCERELIPLNEALAYPDVSEVVPPDNYPTVEHVVPRSMGGTDDITNLVVACYPCNKLKDDTPPAPGDLAKLRTRRDRGVQ